MSSFEISIPHDTIINNILVNRINPGENDSIVLELSMVDGSKRILLFEDVYCINLNMNFGIKADESIREAKIDYQDAELNDIKKKWQRIGVSLDELKCFIINTNSTNSVMKIYAKSFQIQNR